MGSNTLVYSVSFRNAQSWQVVGIFILFEWRIKEIVISGSIFI